VVLIYDNQLKIANFRSLSSFKTRIADEGGTLLGEVETVEFEGVSFAYPGSGAKALEDVSFSLLPREKVAIVGLNGSGKSTLTKLLLRMYEPDSGAIYINGIDIREYPISEIRRNFSVYFQDMHNYSFTLRENLSIADAYKECTDGEAEIAFGNSDGLGILGKSPKRLDAGLTRFIDKDGIELSGGGKPESGPREGVLPVAYGPDTGRAVVQP
jgi:ABC-type multidrug transport system fused ATPase/permease subunit